MSKTRGQVPDDQLRGYLNNHLPSREKIEQIRAAGICADDPWVEGFAETLLEIRQAVRGGGKYAIVRHWNDGDQDA